MRSIVRGLFNEREKKEKDQTIEIFDKDILGKIIRLMDRYSINENVPLAGRIDSTSLFLDRLSYHFSEGKIVSHHGLTQLYTLFQKSELNEFLSTIELYLETFRNICGEYYYGKHRHLNEFIAELNNLLALKTIPFRVEISGNKIFMDRINSSKEEENKNKVYEIVDLVEFSEVNGHFTNSLINFAKKNYPNCIEESYLALEKYLKIKVGNHKIAANKAYAEFMKKYNIKRGLFKIYPGKIKDKIDFVYSIRSELKSHSDKKLFDRKDFLEETARFQLNEVMNLIILLNSFEKNEN